jgi:hypothetical protein
VQCNRAYARESQIRENRNAAAFPVRKPPIVADYSIRKTYSRLFDLLEKAFEGKDPYYKGDDKSIDPFEENRQKQVVGLIRTGFLKRFESSAAAFKLSCDRLMRKLLAFIERRSETGGEKKRLERWKHQNADVLNYVVHRQAELWKDEGDEDQDEGDGYAQKNFCKSLSTPGCATARFVNLLARALQRSRHEQSLPRGNE